MSEEVTSFAGEIIECPHCGKKASALAIALHEPKCQKRMNRKRRKKHDTV